MDVYFAFNLTPPIPETLVPLSESLLQKSNSALVLVLLLLLVLDFPSLFEEEDENEDGEETGGVTFATAFS